MHGPIRDRLEDLLSADRSQPDRIMTEDHLAACDECAGELEEMRRQSTQFRMLRPSDDLEPVAGFYARVLQRIEEGQVVSFWSVFMDATYTRRFAMATLTVLVGLGVYAAAGDMRPRTPQSLVAFSGSESHYDVPVTGSTLQKRDAVLENFETYHLVNAEGQAR